MTVWNWTDDYSTAYARTDDPRVLAIIRRDADPREPYGDALAPAYWVGGRTSRAGDVYHDGESDEIARAYARARYYFVNWHYYGNGRRRLDVDKILARYLRIFYGAEVAEAWSSVHQGYGVRIFSTPNFREHVGTPTGPMPWRVTSVTAPGEGFRESEHNGALTEAEARWQHLLTEADGDRRRVTSCERVSILDGDVAEWKAYLDGDVFGIGYAVRESQVLPAEDVDLADWDVTIECWGFYGDEYAMESALAFEHGSPDLDPLLPLDVA